MELKSICQVELVNSFAYLAQQTDGNPPQTITNHTEVWLPEY